MGRDRAAYMREYRRRNGMGLHETAQVQHIQLQDANDRIRALEDEVARLKRELAARPVPGPSFNSRPFTPVPKKGK